MPGDVDQAPVGHAGRQEAEADLGRDDDDRRGRAVELIGQRLDLGDQVVVGGRSRSAVRRFDSQIVKRSMTTAPWPASVAGSSVAASLLGASMSCQAAS